MTATTPHLTLYNTLTRQKDRFVPLDENRVSMYVCGPTVYNHAHIGNARPAVVFDVLARVLRRLYADVVYVRNITDIEDKIIEMAQAEGVEISVITERYADIYRADMGALGVALPDVEPLATETIPEMIAMMERLIGAGHAYEAEGHVLFDVPSFADYGALSRRPMDEMIAGARVEVAPYKKNASDFVLWKPSTDDQPGWESPWGRGRPGWHIECSAMIEKHLGETIDIHGGGIDLQFPHHENELAQSLCSHEGAPFARYWLHNGFVNMNAEKMSKSLGNVLLVHDLIKAAPGEAIRLALLNAHYRQPLEWNDDVLPQSKAMLDRLYGAIRHLGDVVPPKKLMTDDVVPEAFLAALLDDLNTPKALSELFVIAKQANVATDDGERARLKAALIQSGFLLGILQQDANSWFEGEVAGASDLDAAAIEAQIEARNTARAAKDFAEADRIRDALADAGVLIEDGPEGTKWKLAG